MSTTAAQCSKRTLLEFIHHDVQIFLILNVMLKLDHIQVVKWAMYFYFVEGSLFVFYLNNELIRNYFAYY